MRIISLEIPRNIAYSMQNIISFLHAYKSLMTNNLEISIRYIVDEKSHEYFLGSYKNNPEKYYAPIPVLFPIIILVEKLLLNHQVIKLLNHCC